MPIRAAVGMQGRDPTGELNAIDGGRGVDQVAPRPAAGLHPESDVAAIRRVVARGLTDEADDIPFHLFEPGDVLSFVVSASREQGKSHCDNE